MKKRLLNILLALASASLIMTSCDMLGMGGYNITDQSSVEDIKETIIKELGPDAVIYNIYMASWQEYSFKIKHVTVGYSEPGSDEIKAIAIDYSPRKVEEARPAGLTSRKPESGIPLKDVDFSGIASNIERATAILKENNAGVDGISKYRIYIQSLSPDSSFHEFELEEKGQKAFQINGYDYIPKYTHTFRVYTDGRMEYME